MLHDQLHSGIALAEQTDVPFPSLSIRPKLSRS